MLLRHYTPGILSLSRIMTPNKSIRHSTHTYSVRDHVTKQYNLVLAVGGDAAQFNRILQVSRRIGHASQAQGLLNGDKHKDKSAAPFTATLQYSY